MTPPKLTFPLLYDLTRVHSDIPFSGRVKSLQFCVVLIWLFSMQIIEVTAGSLLISEFCKKKNVKLLKHLPTAFPSCHACTY